MEWETFIATFETTDLQALFVILAGLNLVILFGFLRWVAVNALELFLE